MAGISQPHAAAANGGGNGRHCVLLSQSHLSQPLFQMKQCIAIGLVRILHRNPRPLLKHLPNMKRFYLTWFLAMKPRQPLLLILLAKIGFRVPIQRRLFKVLLPNGLRHLPSRLNCPLFQTGQFRRRGTSVQACL